MTRWRSRSYGVNSPPTIRYPWDLLWKKSWRDRFKAFVTNSHIQSRMRPLVHLLVANWLPARRLPGLASYRHPVTKLRFGGCLCHLDTEEMALGVSLFKGQSSTRSRLAYAESTSLSMSQIPLP